MAGKLDNEIVGIHFSDGAYVKQGDLLVTFDSRSLEAQVAQAEGTLARDQAQLAGTERDLRRFVPAFPSPRLRCRRRPPSTR
jgi:multidrug efflux pump subunit AcrA (membrane-fusion protein)